MFPQKPFGYQQREESEHNIIDKIILQDEKVVVLTNEDVNACATGKSSIASSICSNSRVIEHFTDGIMWLPSNNFMSLNSKIFESVLEYLFEELCRNICPELHFMYSCSHHGGANEVNRSSPLSCVSLFWVSKIHEVMSTMGPTPKFLLVLDNFYNDDVVPFLQTLGVSVIITSRSFSLTDFNCVRVSTVLDTMTNVTIFDDVSISDISRKDDRQPKFAYSLSSLLQSVYKLGYTDCAKQRTELRHDEMSVSGSMVTKLLCQFASASKDMKEKFVLLTSIPSGVFVPVSLVYFIWSNASVQGQTSSLICKEEDLTNLYQMSLIDLSPNKEMMMISSASKDVMDLICRNKEEQRAANEEVGTFSAFKEDAQEILEYALTHDKDDFLSFHFHRPVYSMSLFACFESLQWAECVILKNYTTMFEREIESSQFRAKNFSSQLIVLSDIERVIKTLFLSKDITDKKRQPRNVKYDSNVSSATSFVNWCHDWLGKIVHCKRSLYDVYHHVSTPPVSFCSSLAFLATLSFQCGLVEEAIALRKEVVFIQRDHLHEQDLELAKSLFCLADSQLLACELAEKNGMKVTESANALEEAENSCRLGLHCCEGNEDSILATLLTDWFLSILVDVLSFQEPSESKRNEIFELLHDKVSGRRHFYNDEHHLHIADSYLKLAEVSYAMGDVGDATELMNTYICALRHNYSECPSITAHIRTCTEYATSATDICSLKADKTSNFPTNASILTHQECQSQDIVNLPGSSRIQQQQCFSQREKDFQHCQYHEHEEQQQGYDEDKVHIGLGSKLDAGKIQKRIVGRSTDDAILLIALADRIFKKDANYNKAKKYVLKALKIISQCNNDAQNRMSDSGYEAETKSLSVNNHIIKWSAYNKLADINSCEGNIQEAAKYYQRALRGFLSIDVESVDCIWGDSLPQRREQKGEAIVIAYNLAILVDNSVNFESSVALYENVVEILCAVNSILSDQERGGVISTLPPYSLLEHALTLEVIADRFEEETHNTTFSSAGGVENPTVMFGGGNESVHGMNMMRFVIRVRTLACTLFSFHVGPDDEATHRCKNKIHRMSTDGCVDIAEDTDHCKGADDNNSSVGVADMTAEEHNVDSVSERGEYIYPQQVLPDVIQPELLQEFDKVEEDYGPSSLRKACSSMNFQIYSDKEIEPKDSNVYVFASGCCRRNQLHSNTFNGSKSCTYIGTTSTIEKYYMFVNKRDGKPFISSRPLPSAYAGVNKGVSCTLTGEVYRVPGPFLALLREDYTDVTSTHEVVSVKPTNDMWRSDGLDSDLDSGLVHLHVATVDDMSEAFVANCRNIPRGNYTEFIRARGGVETFIENSKSSLK